MFCQSTRYSNDSKCFVSSGNLTQLNTGLLIIMIKNSDILYNENKFIKPSCIRLSLVKFRNHKIGLYKSPPPFFFKYMYISYSISLWRGGGWSMILNCWCIGEQHSSNNIIILLYLYSSRNSKIRRGSERKYFKNIIL